MSIRTITLSGNTVNLVALPATPGLRSVEFDVTDAVGMVTSPFTGQQQAQQWPGADLWSGMMTLPPLTQQQADPWIAFLMECRGRLNPFLLGDPLKTSPAGNVQGSQPVVDGSTASWNAAMGSLLHTKGWKHGAARLLLPGDYVQIGYRLHRNLDVVTADSNGLATLNLWPSLREAPTDGETVTLHNASGLFRLAQNKRTWGADMTRLTHLSFAVQEYR